MRIAILSRTSKFSEHAAFYNQFSHETPWKLSVWKFSLKENPPGGSSREFSRCQTWNFGILVELDDILSGSEPWHVFQCILSVWPLLGPQFVGGRDTLRFPMEISLNVEKWTWKPRRVARITLVFFVWGWNHAENMDPQVVQHTPKSKVVLVSPRSRQMRKHRCVFSQVKQQQEKLSNDRMWWSMVVSNKSNQKWPLPDWRYRCNGIFWKCHPKPIYFVTMKGFTNSWCTLPIVKENTTDKY